MSIRGVIFDLDGTLVDSMPMWQNLGERFLSSKGISASPALGKALSAMTFSEAAVYLKREYALSESPAEIVQSTVDMVRQYYAKEALLKPGAADFLKGMHEKGIPMSVATGSDKACAEAVLARQNVKQYISHFFTTEEVGKGKTDAAVYHAARAAMGTRTEETLVFEDAFFAARTAKEAGYPVCAVFDAAEKEQAGLKKLADFYIEDFEKALKLF